MSNPFDPKQLALKQSHKMQEKGPVVPRHKPGEYFLKGPIAWNWLSLAAGQSGKALHVAIALWFLVGVKKNPRITLSGSILKKLGVGRHSGYRGLKKLEEASLVKVQRHPGRNPIVTVLEISKGDDVE